jgi:hypothetical protein
MGWFTRKVLVTFIDDATGVAFATTRIPPTDLPETFNTETTLHLGESDWSVVHAEPLTRESYARSRSLVLRLRKIEKVGTDTILFSQLDITPEFDNNQRLRNDEWISTTPLNSMVPNPEAAGLPQVHADLEEVYGKASKLSALRESISIPDDGVYCPICHIANVDIGKLRTPCPQCGRALLKFGWT